jgi:hypothetical protein
MKLLMITVAALLIGLYVWTPKTGKGSAPGAPRSAHQPTVFLRAFSNQPQLGMRHAHFMPNSLNTRLTHCECIPVSSAIRLRGTPLETGPSHPIWFSVTIQILLNGGH